MANKSNEDVKTPVAPVVDEEARAGIARVESALGDLIGLIKDERKEREAMKEQLDFVADKSRQMMWDEKTSAGKDSAKVYKIAWYNGKRVIMWPDMVTNAIWQEQNKMWVEQQSTILYYEDGTEEKVEYKGWQLGRVMEDTVTEGEELSANTRIMKLVTKDGKKFSINVKFLN